jgi:hypothetical protein
MHLQRRWRKQNAISGGGSGNAALHVICDYVESTQSNQEFPDPRFHRVFTATKKWEYSEYNVTGTRDQGRQWGCRKQLESAPELKPLCDTPLLLVRWFTCYSRTRYRTIAKFFGGYGKWLEYVAEVSICRKHSSTPFCLKRAMFQEGPATHLRLVSIACRSYETKPDFAGPPRWNVANARNASIIIPNDNAALSIISV